MESVKHMDQREIQKLGGKASRYPASYVVCHFLERYSLRRVLDVTYGEGRFYAYKRPEFLVGADPRVWNWVVKPDIFINRPVWSLRRILERINVEFDVVVCDPPRWERGTRYRKRDLFSYVVGGAAAIIDHSFKLASELGVGKLLLHYKDVLRGRKVVEDVEFLYVARYLNNPELRTTHFTLYEV